MRRGGGEDGECKGSRNGKGEDGWKSLREQLYRRWELLGICYSKMADRRVSIHTCITFWT